MMPAPIEFPRVTAIPKVTPRMRSRLPVEAGGFGLAANRDGSGKGGFCFGDCCVGIE